MNPMVFDSFVKMCKTKRVPYFACRFEKRFVCVLCDKILEKSHRKGHRELGAARAPFGSECNTCSRVFKNRNSLRHHQRTFHSDMKAPIEKPKKSTGQLEEAKCDICFKVFKNRKSLSTHRYKSHKSTSQDSVVEPVQPDLMSHQGVTMEKDEPKTSLI